MAKTDKIAEVRFSDLPSLHMEMEEELTALFKEALRTGKFIGGEAVSGFEKSFSAYTGAGFAVGTGSGTDALRFAIKASGVGRADIVITAPNTFIATTEAITQAGATPDFADIDERTFNIDPQKLREYLDENCALDPSSGKTIHKRSGLRIAAIIPVHLYGLTADMDSILEIAEEFNITVIEDACQAHGARYFSKKENRWMSAGAMGKAAAFSFYPGKNLGACGEAGALTTGDEGLAKTVLQLRDHGQREKYIHEMEGYNGRLDSIQAGILDLKLKKLAGWNGKRRRAARRYNELLAGSGVLTPFAPDWSEHVYHLYVIRSPERDRLQKHLSGHGIETGLHYPVPLHLQRCYSWLGYKENSFPVCERLAKEILSLPMHPHLTDAMALKVAQAIKTFR